MSDPAPLELYHTANAWTCLSEGTLKLVFDEFSIPRPAEGDELMIEAPRRANP